MAEKDNQAFSPVSTITNYEERPFEIPQAFNVDGLVPAQDKQANAPEVAKFGQEPMYVVSNGDGDYKEETLRNSSHHSEGPVTQDKGGEATKKRRLCGMSP